jgi:dienelactone hydrolase
VAYYPLCNDKAEASVPTLIPIGEKDDWVDVAACQALKGKANFEVEVLLGAGHAFTLQFDKPFEWAGHKLAYDEASTTQAAQLVERFIDAQLK